jgi:hypothetical protein
MKNLLLDPQTEAAFLASSAAAVGSFAPFIILLLAIELRRKEDDFNLNMLQVAGYCNFSLLSVMLLTVLPQRLTQAQYLTQTKYGLEIGLAAGLVLVAGRALVAVTVWLFDRLRAPVTGSKSVN